MRLFLERRRLSEGGAYFNVNTQRCGAYWRAVLVWGPALIRRNTLIIHVHFGSSQPPVPLKTKTDASLINETWTTTPINLLKKNLTCTSICKAYFMKIFADAKASLVFINSKCRSSRSQMFFKIGVLKNFIIFTGKHLCWSLFLIKLQAFNCFPVNNAKILKAAFLWNNSGGYFCRCFVLHYIFKKTLLSIL